jgi:hypothetical protein
VIADEDRDRTARGGARDARDGGGGRAVATERAGFRSLGVIDRLVCDNLELTLWFALSADTEQHTYPEAMRGR